MTSPLLLGNNALAGGGGGGGDHPDSDHATLLDGATHDARDHTGVPGVGGGGAVEVLSGLDASKPAAGQADRLYVSTDAPFVIYRDTGAAWVEAARGETGIRLAQLAEKAHSSLTGLTTGDPHTQYVAKSLFDANTILAATADDTPTALTVATSTFVGRKASGGIAAMTPGEARTELGITTRRLLLFPEGATPPDGSGSGNNPATLEKVISSGAQTSNTPKVSYVHALFDQSTDEHLLWHLALPGDYASGGTLRLLWGAKVTTGDVVWKAGVEAGDASSTDMDAAVFNAADVAAASTVPGTVGQFKETTIALTMTGASAGDEVVLFVGRDADAGGDTAAGDATLRSVIFEYER